MKNTILLFLTFLPTLLYGQENTSKKPEYVIIINNEIVSRQQVDEYAKQGYVKAMQKGVSDEKHDELAQKLGDKIGDKEFVVLISLYSEKEWKEKQKNANIKKPSTKKTKADDGFKLHINDAAKNFSVEMINGETIRLSDLKGKVVLLNFWATWCAPCLMEFYEMPSKILKPFKNDQFVFLPVSIGESREKVAKKMKRLGKDGLIFNVGIDPDKSIWNLYASKSIPKNILIDKNGIIRFTSTGYNEGNLDKLAMEIKKLLKE